MARTYSSKKIDLVYEQVEISAEEFQDRLDDAFNILFDESLEYLKENPQLSLNGKEVSYDEASSNLLSSSV